MITWRNQIDMDRLIDILERNVTFRIGFHRVEEFLTMEEMTL